MNDDGTKTVHFATVEGVDDVSPTISGTVSGRFIDLLQPDWREIDVNDLAHALSQIRRWAGQSRRPISDAEHCLLVGRLVTPRFRLAALLHDAHEAIIGDLIKPFEHALVAILGENVAWAVKGIKFSIDEAIARAVLETFASAAMETAPTIQIEAHALACEMWSDEVRSADERAGRLENAVRRRDALQRLDDFGQTAARHVPAWAPDEGACRAEWLDLVKALTEARFAGLSV
jgi:5'-deoxynucleotidase YfbR-like HD superfamily hydrolase